MSIPPIPTRLVHQLALLLLTVIVGGYYTFFWKHALNIPTGDDLIVIFKFLFQWDKADSIGQKWVYLSENFIDHRLIFTRLSALMTRSLLGQLDMRAVMLIGNSCLIGLLLLFWRVLRFWQHTLLLLVPIALILFNPLAYEGNFWSIASTNYMPVIFLALLSFYALTTASAVSSRSAARWRLAGAVGTGIMTSFTFANGLLVWPVGLALLVLQRQFRTAVVWLAAAAATGVLYAVGFSYSNQPDAVGNLLSNWPNILLSFFAFVGATINLNDTIHSLSVADYPSIGLGLLMTAWLVWQGYQMIRRQPLFDAKTTHTATARYKQTLELFMVGSIVFLLGSCAAQSIGRTFEDRLPIDSRYRNFSLLLLATVYLTTVYKANFRRLSSRVVLTGWLSLTVVMCTFNYTFYTPRLRQMQANVKAGLLNWQRNQNWIVYRGFDYFDFAVDQTSEKIERQAKATSFYQFPTLYRPGESANFTEVASLVKADIQIKKQPHATYLFVRHTLPGSIPGDPLVCLRSGNKEWLIHAQYVLSVRKLLTHATPVTNTVAASVMLYQKTGNNLPEGYYDLSIKYANDSVTVAHSPLYAYQVLISDTVCTLVAKNLETIVSQ